VLVEFLEGGAFVCGWVLDTEGSKRRLEIRLPGGKIVYVNPNRLLGQSFEADISGNSAIDELLTKTDKRRAQLASSVDLKDLWESLEGEGPEFDYDLLAGLYFGRNSDPDDISAMIRAIYTDGLWFEFSPQTTKRREIDQIERVKTIRERELNKKIFKENASIWLAEATSGKVAPEPEEAQTVRDLLLELMLHGDEAASANQTKELLKMASLSGDANGAFTALVAIGDISSHENVPLLRLGMPLEFTDDVLKDTTELFTAFTKADGTFNDAKDRTDLTELYTVTVDSPGAKEYDDALSLECHNDGSKTLWIHIADVAAAVPPGTITDNFASQRPASIYLPDARYPMLPEIITENLLSLKKGSVRPAFTLKVCFDSGLNITSSLFMPSKILVDQQVSFQEAEDELDKDNESELTKLYSLSQDLLADRLAKGGRNLRLPRVNVRLNPDGTPEVYLVDSETRSGLMVEEMMILANHFAAKTLAEAGYPCPFRYQGVSQNCPWEVKEPASPRMLLAADLASRRFTGLGGVSLEPYVHHGIGLGLYTSFTSPMRRYLDLLVARQLRALSLASPPVYDSTELMTRALNFDEDYRQIKKVQFGRHRYWLLSLLASRVGAEFVALVFNRRGRKGRICLTDYMLESELTYLPQDIGPGQDVVVKLVRCQPQFIDRPEALLFEYIRQV
jgi:exoribonuclease-2